MVSETLRNSMFASHQQGYITSAVRTPRLADEQKRELCRNISNMSKEAFIISLRNLAVNHIVSDIVVLNTETRENTFLKHIISHQLQTDRVIIFIMQ